MKPYSTTTKENFDWYKQFDVDSLDLDKYVRSHPTFQNLTELFGFGYDECIVACEKLGIQNRELLDIDYYPSGYSGQGVLLDDNAATRKECDKRGNYYTTNYSAYVVPYYYASCVGGKLARYFFEKFYADIFLHPDFTKDELITVDPEDMTLSQIISEFGNMTLREARCSLPLQSAKTYHIQRSKFSIYDIGYNTEHYEVYLETADGTLYIPVQAIFQRDYSLIEKRQRGYYSEYYKGKPDQIEKALMPLYSSEAQLLRQLLTND